MRYIKKPKKRETFPRLADDALQALPVLALDRLVLMPSSWLWIRVHGTRALAVIDWCRRHDCVTLAMPALLWDHDEDDGATPFHEVFGAGYLVETLAAPGGGYSILVRGVERLRRVEELAPEGMVRRVRAERLETVDSDPEAAQAAMDRLRTYVRRMSASKPGTTGPMRRLLDDTSPCSYADSATGLLVPTARQRQEILETLDLGRRYELVLGAVAGRVLESEPSGGAGTAH